MRPDKGLSAIERPVSRLAERRARAAELASKSEGELLQIAIGIQPPECPTPPKEILRKNAGRFVQQAGTIVYWACGADKRVLYVGVTDDFFGRMAAHRSNSPWWNRLETLHWEEWPDRLSALKHERRLIQRHKPPFNTHHNPDKRKAGP